MKVGTSPLRHAAVRGIANEEVVELERLLVLEGRRPAPHDRVVGQPGECAVHLRLEIGRGEQQHRAAMEDLALDRRALECAAFLRRACVEPRRQQRVERWRQVHLLARRREVRDELFEEQRVPSRRREQSSLGARSESAARGELEQEAPSLLVRERLQAHVGGPVGPAGSKLGARETEHEDRFAAASHRVHEELDEWLFRPLKVVDLENERPVGRHDFEEAARRPGDLVGRGGAIGEPEHLREDPRCDGGIRRAGGDPPDAGGAADRSSLSRFAAA